MTSNPGRADFDDLAKNYDQFRTGYSGNLYDSLGELGFRNGMRVLDVACGSGLSMEPLVARGMSVVGIDKSTEMLKAAKQRVPTAALAHGTAESLPFENAFFDGVICAQSFHWFDAAKAYSEMIRVAKSGSPIAIWWKLLASDDDVRRFRNEASKELGLTNSDKILKGGFGAFYAAPLEKRALRVLPHVVRVTVDDWIGYEASRAHVRNDYGERSQAYLDTLRKKMLDVFATPSARIEVRYMQYLYVGYTG
jgi:ubiquinone/menaquinone biosynthesis C-methylase UbiE